MSAFVVMWQIVSGLLAIGSFFSASASGDWTYFWTYTFMFLVPPTLWVAIFIYSLTDAGRAEQARLRRESDKAYALRHPRASTFVFDQALARDASELKEFEGQVERQQVRKPGRLLHPTPENFEEYCRDWCHYLGYDGAVKTQNSRDGGIDIKSPNMIAQVKFQVSPVGVRPIRELNGVRKPGQEVLFFALNGFTSEARREAARMEITLIRVSPIEGQIDILA